MSAEIANVDSLSSRPRLSPVARRQLLRALAAGERQADVARQFGISRQAVSQFARQHPDEIETFKAKLEDEYAGLWIAEKANRITAYEDEYSRAAGHKQADHHEWIKTRVTILHTVAEELGQLPPRQQTVVMPVVHVIESVDLDQLS